MDTFINPFSGKHSTIWVHVVPEVVVEVNIVVFVLVMVEVNVVVIVAACVICLTREERGEKENRIERRKPGKKRKGEEE